jgi:hypothetical protein
MKNRTKMAGVIPDDKVSSIRGSSKILTVSSKDSRLVGLKKRAESKQFYHLF